MKQQPFRIDGKTHQHVRTACRDLGFSPTHLARLLRSGLTGDEAATQIRSRWIVLGGVQYRSSNAAAASVPCSGTHLREQMAKGMTADEVADRVRLRHVTIKGATYLNLKEACEAHNASYSKVYQRLQKGQTLEEAFADSAPRRDAVVLPDSRECVGCWEMKPLSEFWRGKGRCRLCMRLQKIAKTYGEEAIKAFMAAESCEICGTTEPPGNGWHVDHCHDTGSFRGILCTNCNTGLGQFQDSTERLSLAIAYLENKCAQ